jgi:hypothetical protein
MERGVYAASTDEEQFSMAFLGALYQRTLKRAEARAPSLNGVNLCFAAWPE